MRLFSLAALEQLTGIPQRTFRLYMAQGRIRYSKIGRRLMVTEADLRAFVEANRVSAPADGSRPAPGPKPAPAAATRIQG